MTSKPWHWVVPEIDNEAVDGLANTLGVHRLTAACLMQRGVSTEEEAHFFLHGSLNDLGDPFSMAGMDKAVDRLANAVRKREKVLIYGDYDADGVTSVALLCHAMQNLDVPVEYYIPSRLGDGYGLHGDILEQYFERGFRLAITVDCGINSFIEMELAERLGLDLIVTDHHDCFPGERKAFSVLNPKQSHCCYPERNLAGVGVAWTLVRALHQHLGVPMDETAKTLDLVAVGSIADVVPLLGENRILVKQGLLKLQNQPLPGLAALARVSGMEDSKLTAMQVAFTVAPRLNAPGRLGDAGPAVEALLADATQADGFAADLDDKNRQRKQVEKDILEQARELAATRCGDSALVLWHEDWHPGVVGIVAGRLATEFARPAVLIASGGEEGHGSIRSVPGCNVVEALQECAHQLVRFGGHPEAAGLTVEVTKLESFREAFCLAVAGQGAKEYTIPVVAEAEPADLTLDLVDELTVLEPFGQGNPEPLFLLRDTAVVTSRCVGSRGNHLQLKLQKNSPVISAICFGGGDNDIPRGAIVDAVASPTVNVWQGRTTLSLHVRDIRICSATSGLTVIDCRGLDKDQQLASLVQNKNVLVWVNTKAAGDYLNTRFGSRIQITQLGRKVPECDVELLFFYHLPFDRSAVERLMANLDFTGDPTLYLAYGGTELLLNERIYAATIPSETTMQQLAAACEQENGQLTVEAARNALPIPITAHLLAKAHTVFEEAAGGKPTDWTNALSGLEDSQTFQESIEVLAAFRACQTFWWEVPASEIARYLEKSTD
jgi:single-stranded-DNA-specific exonuclease